jgi:hypothetical protein
MQTSIMDDKFANDLKGLLDSYLNHCQGCKENCARRRRRAIPCVICKRNVCPRCDEGGPVRYICKFCLFKYPPQK